MFEHGIKALLFMDLVRDLIHLEQEDLADTWLFLFACVSGLRDIELLGHFKCAELHRAHGIRGKYYAA